MRISIDSAMTARLPFTYMAPGDRGENFSMRLSKQDRKEWEEGKALLAEALRVDVSISDFLRLAASEKLERLRDARKKGGR
jgi:hypothetical protein